MRNLLITGAHHEERMKYATSIVLKLLCAQQNEACGHCHNCERVKAGVHPNVVIIEPEDSDTSEIKIDAVRRVIEESQKANFEKGKAIFLVTHMHQITKTAANALLKSIEESKEHKVFLALAPSRMAVLPTIASRLISVIIKPALLTENIDPNMVKIIWSITSKAKALRFANCEFFPASRSELINNLGDLNNTCHQLLRAHFDNTHAEHARSLSPPLAYKLSEALNQALVLLQRNANPRLVTEQLVLRDWPHACH